MYYERDETITSEYIDLATEFKNESDFMGKSANKYHLLLANDKKEWNFRLFAVLLNETNFTQCECRYYDEGFKHYQYFSYFDETDDNIRFIAHLNKDNTITLEASLEFIFAYMNISYEEITTDVGSRGRKTKTLHKKIMTCFQQHWKVKNDSSFAILKSVSISYFSKNYFSKALKMFIKQITSPSFKIHIEENFDTEFIFEYSRCWIKRPLEDHPINSLNDFLEQTLGFLHLSITPFDENDNLPTIKINDKIYTIIDGIYISPFVDELFNKRASYIDGLILDTTWKVVSKYVTSILMTCIRNVGVPVAFTFGDSENKHLYQTFVDKFLTDRGIDLKKFIVESDQGSALRAICDEFKEHIACLRHFLVSLKTSPFSYQVGQLAACKCKKDLCKLLEEFAKDFSEVTEDNIKKQMNKALQKIGMQFENGVIMIKNENRWKKVSMLERSKMCMPSTTNTLEATHGHLNGKTPRRNEFWQSLNRVTKALLKKDFLLNERIHSTYNNQKRKILKRVKMLPKERMESEIQFYETKIDTCLCGDTALMSAMLRINIPCSHRIKLGASFPCLEDVEFELIPSTTKCTFKYTIIEREPPKTNEEHICWLKNSAISTIRRYSHFKHRSQIKEFVERNFSLGTSFVNGRPLEYYSLVHKGILEFDVQRRVKENSKDPDESSSIGTESE